jgi:septum site-determining protein MinD
MSKVVVVTSGKGGVGKTTSTAALGGALAQQGHRVVVVDFDVGLRNLDLIMGAERRVVFDMVNVLRGEANLRQALIRDKRLDNLVLLPASQTQDKDALTEEGVARIIDQLRQEFDWVICDSPAGIEKGATLAMAHAEIAVVVTNPEVSSVRDSDRIIGLLDSKTELAKIGKRLTRYLLLTRYDAARAARAEMMKAEDVQEVLAIDFLGIVPESTDVLRASNTGVPVTLAAKPGAAAKAYVDAARRLAGEQIPAVVTALTYASGRGGMIGRMFGRAAR